MSRSVHRITGPLLAALSLIVLATLPQADADDRPPPSVVVTGSGEAAAAPDTAEVHVGVAATDARANAAIKAAGERARAVLAALKALGVAGKDVQTSTVSLRPVMNRPEPRPAGGVERPRITGYEARINHRVTVRDIGRLGGVLDAVVAAGANDIGGIRFTVSDDLKLLETARQAAMADARRTAETLVREAGAGLGKVIAIEEMEFGGPWPAAATMMRADSAGVPVAPGEVTVRARVRVTYGIDTEKK